VNVLALIHGDDARGGVFTDAIEARGHRYEEWSHAWERPLPRPLDDYGAVIVFGGAMHADQDDHHPWLRDETLFLQRLLDTHVPTLGVCLGVQLLARAAHAPVMPAAQPEIGWHHVELTAAAAHDAVLGSLPRRFDAFQWHYYTYGVPAGAVELGRSRCCTQAFRLGKAAWGVQFHPEVTAQQIERWTTEDAGGPFDRTEVLVETQPRIARWNELGRGLCDAFCAVAERGASRAAA
jgi:GMP synthase (glutamine-hydrolysing)